MYESLNYLKYVSKQNSLPINYLDYKQNNDFIIFKIIKFM